MSNDVKPVLEHLNGELDGALERVKALLRIRSISTDSAYDDETTRAAEWCAQQLRDIGFAADARPTPGHPMVVAHHAAAAPDRPRLLYYGHYDVQPPEPLGPWNSDPFDPTIVEAEHGPRLVARGACDDKGQLMTFIEAFRAWKTVHGELPVNVTVMLEGEEESGSPSLEDFLRANHDELQADACVVCDTGMWDIETPAITYMLRGMVYFEVTLHGPSHDLHSGMYGGAVLNPLNALTRTLGDLHDADGCVQIPGFYDDVQELSEVELEQWNALGFDDGAFVGSAGLDDSTGERNRSVLERIWSRPTCDINGVWGGYTGEGAKTVIPAQASAKLSCRLVAGQDPAKILDGITRFFEARTPPGGRWTFKDHGANPAIRVPTDSRYLGATQDALESTFGRAPVLIGSGGSIPVVGSIREILGFDSLLVGFGLDDDRIHSPNEKFEVRCFEMGVRSHVAMLDAFSRVPVGASV